MTSEEIDARVDKLMASLDSEFAPIGVEISERLRDVPALVALFIVLRQAAACVLARVPPSRRIACADSLADEIADDARESLD